MGNVRNRIILTKPSKLYCMILTAVAVLSLFYFMWKKPNNDYIHVRSEEISYTYDEYQQRTVHSNSEAFIGERIIHIDLKGAPPKISYFAQIFPLLSKLGATGLLIEYEDMFPYRRELANITALNAYTLNDITTINKLAAKNNLKVIPLIQTFGHMEWILKLKEFKEYREVPNFPQVICPTHHLTISLISSIISQIVHAHPNSSMIHIGADEVYYLGQCNRCTDFMLNYNLSKTMLFFEHVNTVVGVINRLYPKLRVLVWDDEFRSITPIELKKSNLNKNIEPVVWKYSKEVYEELGPSLWEGYANIFPKVWVASAFKGAIGSNEFVSHVSHYVQNHRSWLSVINEYKTQINFEGIIITGWQRYDHFAILCELLPVGIPTLAMCLRLLLGYNDSPLSPPTDVAKILHCDQPYALIGPAFGSPKCSFPGANILEGILHFQQLKQEFESILDDSRVRGWMSEYNIKQGFSSPSYVDGVTSSLSGIKNELVKFNEDITIAMQEAYDNFTIDEWKETYVKPLEEKVTALWNARNELLAKDSWPRRPLKHDET